MQQSTWTKAFSSVKKTVTSFMNDGVDDVEVIDLQPVALTRSLAYRRFLRSVFRAPARLTLAGMQHQVQMLDVSFKGALVQWSDPNALRPPVIPGARGRLRLPLTDLDVIAMDVAVARVGVREIGLKCVHIDLDSMTHLRQLIERNMQDPALLGRELSLLIGWTPQYGTA